MTIRGSPNSTGWASVTMIDFTVPARGDSIGLKVFMASTNISVSPFFTLSPTEMKADAPGSGERYAVPTIGEVTALAGGAASEDVSAGELAGATWLAGAAATC